MKRCLALILAVLLLLMALPAVSVAAEYATVKGGWLRLRSYPSYDSQTLASYYTGTVVELLGTSGPWYHVRLSDGKTGYMHGDYLSKGASSPVQGITEGNGGSAADGTNATVVSTNGYGVRLRVGPGTNYRIIRSFPVGTPATILQSGSYWCKISIGGYTGYMMSQFLSTGSSQSNGGGSSGNGGSGNSGSGNGSSGYSFNSPVTYVGDATIWSGNGYGVRLRTGPGTQYSKIGVYSVGTKVKIITKGAEWDYIQVGSRRGYMMNEFLLYNNQYTVTGVTINNLRPVVGNVLAVQTVTPSTASVTYEWLVKPEGGSETVKGTSAAYLVTDGDIGATIRLRITGTGSYKGTALSASTEKVVRTGKVENLILNTLSPYVGDVLKATVQPADAAVNYYWYVGGELKGTASTYRVVSEDQGKAITARVEGKYPFSGDCSVTTNLVMAMNAPVIETETLPDGRYQTAYRQQLTAFGGGSHSWSIIKGALPAGLALSKDGLISGTPTGCGTSSFTVRAANQIGSAEKALTLTIDEAMVSISAVEGVGIPAANDPAVVALPGTDQYSGTVTWKPALTDDKFAPSTVYTAVISLTAKPNYTFTGLTSSFFTVSGSTGASSIIGSDGSTATVTAVFPATAAATAAKLPKPVISGIVKQGSDWIISWSEVENATGYMLRICTEVWREVDANHYTISGVPASGTYQVFAVGDGVNYSDSDTADYVFTMPVAIPLNAPAGVKIEQVNGSWVLSWDAVANAIAYRLRQTNGSNSWQASAANSFTLAEPPKAGDRFEIVAVGDGVYYTDSAAAAYTFTAPAIKLDAPENLTIAERNAAWTAEWDSVEKATGYRFGDTLGNWYACSSTSFVFAGTPAAGTYRVYAVGDGITFIDSDSTEYAYLTDPLPAPQRLPAPTELSIQKRDGVWTAVWSAVQSATGYRFCGEDGVIAAVTEPAYTFPGEPECGVYSVYAVGDGINYVDSAPVTYAYLTDPLPPPQLERLAAPAELIISEEAGVWTADWIGVPNAVSYRFRKNGGSWIDCENTVYTFINPPATAEYSVMAVGDGMMYADSEPTTLSYTAPEAAPLPAPANLTIQVKEGVWSAKWDRVAHAEGYRFRKNNGSWLDCNENSYIFTNPPATAEYSVMAVGDGSFFADSKATTISYTAPEAERLPAPARLTITDNDGVWIARWDSVPNATGYRFRRAGGSWQDCGSNSYSFAAPPQSGEYVVIAVGDGITATDSAETTIDYVRIDEDFLLFAVDEVVQKNENNAE